MKKFFVFLLTFSGLQFGFSQKLILDFPLYNYPYNNIAFNTFDKNPKFITSPSMYQSVNLSADLVNTTFYFSKKINFNITRYALVNALISSAYYTAVYVFLEYVPGGIAWTHEEYHRSLLTLNNTPSHDEVYDFKMLAQIIRVNDVSDEDLVLFKQNKPQNFIRLHSAGIEGENVLAFELNKRNFFYDQKMPYGSVALSSFLNSIFYIYFCQTWEAESQTEFENAKDGTNIKIRDFTGFDFTAWVYDLYHPFEPYELRGIHPSGIGIDRYVKPSDLSYEQLSLLRKQALLHALNLLSPFNLGIRKIPWKNFYFNFSFRHLLNSFGNDIAFYFYFKNQKTKLISALHFYNNKFLTLPGIEMQLIDYQSKINNWNLFSSAKVLTFLQPENLLYFDTKPKPGFYAEYKLKIGKKQFYPYLDLVYKTKGWIAGEEFLTNAFKFGFGFDIYLK